MHIVRVDFQGLLVPLNGISHSPLLKESIPKVALGFHIVRVDFQGLVKLSNGFFRLSLSQYSQTEISVDFAELGLISKAF